MSANMRSGAGMRARWGGLGNGLPGGLCVALLLGLAGCAPAEEVIPDSASEIGIAGRWLVAERECPGGCTGPAADDQRWAGVTAEYTDSLVVFGEEECRAPSFSAGIEIGDGAGEVERTNGVMGMAGGRLVEIRCAGQRWQVPGSVLVVESDSVVRVMWQGAVLRLERPGG